MSLSAGFICLYSPPPCSGATKAASSNNLNNCRIGAMMGHARIRRHFKGEIQATEAAHE